jgi:hypothetical protein
MNVARMYIEPLYAAYRATALAHLLKVAAFHSR